MRCFLEIKPGHCVECRDAHQALMLARLIVVFKTGNPADC
jgi:hypothetical protein